MNKLNLLTTRLIQDPFKCLHLPCPPIVGERIQQYADLINRTIMNALQFQKKLLSMQENMMNFALSLTANREDAQDLTQDTTLKVLDNQDKFVDNVNFKGWVLTVMRNIFINNYHRIVRQQTIVDPDTLPQVHKEPLERTLRATDLIHPKQREEEKEGPRRKASG